MKNHLLTCLLTRTFYDISVSKILGIDLGTTNTCFGYFDKNHIKLIEDAEGKYLIPSGVLFTDEGDILVGSQARDLAHQYPKKYIYGNEHYNCVCYLSRTYVKKDKVEISIFNFLSGWPLHLGYIYLWLNNMK